MSKETVVQSMCTPTIDIVINSDEEPKAWKLCMDYRALAKIEAETGRDLKKIEAWKDLSSGKDFVVIVWCCLGRYSPTVTLDDVKDNLNPACQRPLSDALFELAFPGVAEAWAKQKEAGATAVPNEPTATV